MVRILVLRRDDGRDPPRDVQVAFGVVGDHRLRDHLRAALDAAIAAYRSPSDERVVHSREFPDRPAAERRRPQGEPPPGVGRPYPVEGRDEDPVDDPGPEEGGQLV